MRGAGSVRRASRVVHRFTAVAWLAGLAHSLGEGTDAGQVWFLVLLGVTTLPALVLLVVRWARGAGARGTLVSAGDGVGVAAARAAATR